MQLLKFTASWGDWQEHENGSKTEQNFWKARLSGQCMRYLSRTNICNRCHAGEPHIHFTPWHLVANYRALLPVSAATACSRRSVEAKIRSHEAVASLGRSILSADHTTHALAFAAIWLHHAQLLLCPPIPDHCIISLAPAPGLMKQRSNALALIALPQLAQTSATMVTGTFRLYASRQKKSSRYFKADDFMWIRRA